MSSGVVAVDVQKAKNNKTDFFLSNYFVRSITLIKEERRMVFAGTYHDAFWNKNCDY